MTDQQDCYFKGTEGMKRLRESMEFLGVFGEGIDRVTLFADKRARHLNAEDRITLADISLKLDEIYWRQFHNFIDKVHAYKKFLA